MRFNSLGDLVGGNVERPWVRWSSGLVDYVWDHRATQLTWLNDTTIVGNFCMDDTNGLWRPLALSLSEGNRSPEVLADFTIRVVRAGGGTWAFDFAATDGWQVRTSWGRDLPGRSLCEVSDDGVVFTTSSDSVGIWIHRADGRSGRITDRPILGADQQTRARAGMVAWVESDGPRLARYS